MLGIRMAALGEKFNLQMSLFYLPHRMALKSLSTRSSRFCIYYYQVTFLNRL